MNWAVGLGTVIAVGLYSLVVFRAGYDRGRSDMHAQIGTVWANFARTVLGPLPAGHQPHAIAMMERAGRLERGAQ